MTVLPCLWFATEAVEAAEHYVSVIPNSRIVAVHATPEAAPGPTGSPMLVDLELDGSRVQALNGGVDFPFSEAVSLVVVVETQDELDRVWAGLLEGGGTEVQCGWLKDRWGLSWQVVPAVLEQIAAEAGTDPERYARAMAAVMGMVKLDVAAIEAAADGVAA